MASHVVGHRPDQQTRTRFALLEGILVDGFEDALGHGDMDALGFEPQTRRIDGDDGLYVVFVEGLVFVDFDGTRARHGLAAQGGTSPQNDGQPGRGWGSAPGPRAGVEVQLTTWSHLGNECSSSHW